jgi:hypothetical protein
VLEGFTRNWLPAANDAHFFGPLEHKPMRILVSPLWRELLELRPQKNFNRADGARR